MIFGETLSPVHSLTWRCPLPAGLTQVETDILYFHLLMSLILETLPRICHAGLSLAVACRGVDAADLVLPEAGVWRGLNFSFALGRQY